VRISVDAQALIAREQAATEAVSPAMLAVTSLRHLTPDKERGPSRRSCLCGRVQRARGRPTGNWSGPRQPAVPGDPGAVVPVPVAYPVQR
jgi:hypothetical protein